VARKRDVKQFRQACREAGLIDSERRAASDDFHAEKDKEGRREDLSYGELVTRLREWKSAHGDD
jgi:hypothetical protein